MVNIQNHLMGVVIRQKHLRKSPRHLSVRELNLRELDPRELNPRELKGKRRIIREVLEEHNKCR